MIGPLTCLWPDLVGEDAFVRREDIILLTQWILVLVGSNSNATYLSRKKWNRLDPILMEIPQEDNTETKILFRRGFMERSMKGMEEKTLSVVTSFQKDGLA